MNARTVLAGVSSLLCGCAAAQPPASQVAPLQPLVADASYSRGYDFVKSACLFLEAAKANAAKDNVPADPEVSRWKEVCAEGTSALTPQIQADPRPAHTARGLLDDACKKFEEARRYDKPTTALTTFLGLCAEQAGFNAKALRLFLEAQVLNKHIPDAGTQADYERQIVAAIERVRGQVAWLTISIEPKPPGLEVLIDDVEVPASDLARKIPVEPGQRQVSARAPAYVDENVTLSIAAEKHDTARLALRARNPYVKQLVVGGMGVAGATALGVAAYFGLRTLNLVSDSNDYCDEENICTDAGANLRDRAVATEARAIGFALSGVAAIGGAGVVYWVW